MAKHRGVFLPRSWPSSVHKNGLMLPGVLQPQQEKVQQEAVAKGHLKEAKVKEKPRVTESTRRRCLGLLALLLGLLVLDLNLEDLSCTARTQDAQVLLARPPSSTMTVLEKDPKGGSAKVVACLGNNLGRSLMMEWHFQTAVSRIGMKNGTSQLKKKKLSRQRKKKTIKV